MCFHLCPMIYTFVDSFLSQFEFGVPNTCSQGNLFHHSTMPQARDQLFVLARGCQWHQTADTLWVWHSTLEASIWQRGERDNLRGPWRYFDHAGSSSKFQMKHTLDGQYVNISLDLVRSCSMFFLLKTVRFFRGVKLFVPSCMVEALRLQALPSVRHPLRQVRDIL